MDVKAQLNFGKSRTSGDWELGAFECLEHSEETTSIGNDERLGDLTFFFTAWRRLFF
jgi:hypothetical protein